MNRKLSLKERVFHIFNILRKDNPHPTTELVYSSHFELLVSVILSAQATDISVNKATSKLYQIANTPQQILNLGIEELEGYIKTIGLYKTKAKNIYNLCQILVGDYDSQVPNNFDELVKLPGVGRKTANVVLNTLFGLPTIAVDTHIFRVSNRLGIAYGKTPLEVENKLNKVIPNEFKQDAHHWLILHGRYICKSRQPLCEKCKISPYCDYIQGTGKIPNGKLCR
ncbi:MAG: endonuclease III [Burkholderiales bacterium]|nr:endonuclease III [Burkholderiales bacterium]